MDQTDDKEPVDLGKPVIAESAPVEEAAVKVEDSKALEEVCYYKYRQLVSL